MILLIYKAKLHLLPGPKKLIIAVNKQFETESAKMIEGQTLRIPKFAFFAKKFSTFIDNCINFSVRFSINAKFL